jgi:two-component system copper resistance phosphate regulon response regulator CusR
MRILLAEDDDAVRSVLARGLAENGYVLDEVARGDDALHMLRLYEYAAAIIDWRMPGLSGDQVVAEARRLNLATPLVMLTARDTTQDKVHGLDAGADDYIVKPVDFGELLARLRAVQRRPRVAVSPVLGVGLLTLDPGTHQVTGGGRPLALTAREFAILEILMRRSPSLVGRLSIAQQAWSDESEAVGSNTIDVHIGHLRRKLSGSGVNLATVRGQGYRLTAA